MQTKEIEFKGQKFEVLDAAGDDFFVLRATIKAKDDPMAIFDAYDIVFQGKTEEYAEKLGRSFELVNELYSLAIGDEAKN